MTFIEPNWKPVMRFFAVTLVIITLLSSGCSWIKFPGVHKINVQQGNILDQDMANKLQPGMSKAQVQFVLGTPIVTDTFNTHRWDYVFRNTSATGVKTEQGITVYFDNKGLMKDVVGDYIPNSIGKTSSTE